jgi:hypothetical protein|tara:strand:- start:2602 stop:2814 length:213 start_codon:yes stop_codon:yes gene_type:complete
MTASEFTLWLHGYLEALESEGITVCKIESIRNKMGEIKNRSNQERVVFGPNVNSPQQQGYAKTPPTNRGL